MFGLMLFEFLKGSFDDSLQFDSHCECIPKTLSDSKMQAT